VADDDWGAVQEADGRMNRTYPDTGSAKYPQPPSYTSACEDFMSKNNVKQLVYRYNGVESSDEVEVDHYGEVPTPNQGDIITRNGKPWKAVHILTQVSSDGSVPVVRVFLTEQL
jgi:hypothetical protein